MKAFASRPLLDRALAGRAFAVDSIACAAAAQVIRRIRPAPSPQDRRARPLDKELTLRIAVAAICHQINWDFLCSRLASVLDDTERAAEFLSEVTSRHVEKWLSGYHRPDRVRAKERAAFLRDVGRVLLHRYGGDPRSLLTLSSGRIYGPGGLMNRLDDFAALREDPLRKKSNVFIHEIVRDEIAHFADQDQIAPAIDYHIMRLYLRTGRVVPLHIETFKTLKRDATPRPRLVRLIREAVGEALSLTALYAGMSIPAVNGIEWEIGRDVCIRARPKCSGPLTDSMARIANQDGGCPYAPFCRAYSDDEWRKLKEPEVKKSFY